MKPLVLILTIVALAGCRTAPPQEEENQVQMKEQVMREVQTPAPDEEPPPDAPEPAAAEELEVEMFELSPSEPFESQSGLVVAQTSRSPLRVEFRRGEDAQSVELGPQTQYAEGVVFDHLWAITRSDGNLQVTLRGEAPAEPLSESEAAALARREMDARLGCEGEAREVATDHGTYVLEVRDGSQITCRIVVGRYTRRPVDL